MNAQERVEHAIHLKTLPRDQVPVAPLIIPFIARLAGTKQAEIFSSVKAWRQAMDLAIDRIGAPDMGFALWPRDVPFSEGMRFKLPGRELGDDELFQIMEDEVMQRADYERVLAVGYGRWSMDYFVSLQPHLPTGRRGRHDCHLPVHSNGPPHSWQCRPPGPHLGHDEHECKRSAARC